MEVSQTLYEWLVEIGVVTTALRTDGGIVTLNESESKRLEEGPGIEVVLRSMAVAQKKTMSLNGELLEAAVSPSSRLYNWNALIQAFQIFGVTVDSDVKSLIVAGDRQMVVEVLTQLHTASSELTPLSSSLNSKKVKMTEDGGLFIDSIDHEKPLFEAESCLEYLILSFCHNFDLVPKQAAGLMVQGNKYLVHIAAKGLRGDFDPVIYWYQNIYTNSSHLADLLEIDKGDSLTFVLDALKTGLMSRNVEVVQWACRLFGKLALDLHDKQMLNKAWEWFVLPQSGLELGFLATQRHKEATEVAVEMLLHFGAGHLVDLFTIYLRNFLQETADYLHFITDLLHHAGSLEILQDELNNAGITGYWCELAFREAEMDSNRSNSAKLFSMAFLLDMWKRFYASQTEDIMIDALISCYKRISREEGIALKLTSVVLLFECLELLVEIKNKAAVMLYKSLTFILLENFANSALRELLFFNFKALLENYQTMPTWVLIDPLVKRLQMVELVYFTFDFDFFMTLANHPTTEVESAVLLIDVLGRIYISDIVYARAASVPFTTLASRYIDREPMARYLETFCSLAIKTAVSVSKAAVPPSYSSLKTDSRVEAVDIAASRQKRTIVLDMVCWIVQQDTQVLNSLIKDMLIKTNRLYSKQSGSDLNCLMVVLSLFGEPLQVISNFYEENPSIYQEDFPMLPATAEALTESDSEELLGEEEFLALVPLKLTHDDRQTTHVKPKRSEFPWQRVHASMEQAKAKRQEMERRRREEAEEALRKEDLRRRKVESALKIRRLEQGIQRGTSASNLIGEGQASKLLTAQPQVLLVFDPEDKDEEDCVKVVLKRYSRLFKVMFQKYAGTGFARKQQGKSEIDWLTERRDKITEAELLKCLKDYGVVPKLLTKEEVGEILKQYNHKIAKSTEVTVLEYDGLLGVLCQLAYFAFSRSPVNMAGLPAATLVKALIMHIRAYCKAAGISTEVIDEGDPGTGDREVVRKLNGLLKDNPETPMPENYIRVIEKDIVLEYSVSKVAVSQPSTRLALELLDEILFGAVGTHFLEPVVSVTQTYRARGHVPKKPEVPLPPIHERPPSLMKRRFKENSEVMTQNLKQRILQEVKLNSTLKLLVAQAPHDDRSRVAIVAEVLEGLLTSVSLGLNRLITRNKTIVAKDSKKLLPEPVDAERAARLKKRDLEIRIELSKAREEREAKQREEAAKQKEISDDEDRRRKLREAKLKKEFDERSKQMKLWKEDKAAKLKVSEQASKTRNIDKKKNDEQRQRIEELIKSSIEEKKQSYLKLRQSEENKAQPLLDLEVHKRMSEKLLAKERINRQTAEERKNELATLLASTEVNELMATYNKQLELVFLQYCKRSEIKIEQGVETALTNLYAADLVKLALEIGISPAYATTDQVGKLFRYITRNKDIAPKMLNFSDFQEALVRIAAGAKEKLSEDGTLTVWTVDSLLRAIGLTESVKAVGQRMKDIQDHPNLLVRKTHGTSET